MRKLALILVVVLVLVCCLCAGGSGGLAYFWVSAQPALAKEMHTVNWSAADVTSWETKNDQFLADIKKAHDAGQKTEVQLEVTEAESTAVIAQMVDDIMADDSPTGIKRQIIDATGGLVTGVSSVQVNYLKGWTYASAVVKVRGFDVKVGVKSRTEIVNGTPRRVIDKYEAGLIPIPQQAKDLAMEWFGPGKETFTFSIGPNAYTVGNLVFAGDSASADYTVEGISEYVDLTSISMEQGKLVMRGVTK